MGFVELPDNRGLLYIPDRREKAAPKHSCPDCHCCQHCSDDRCALCRPNRPCVGKKDPEER